MIVEVKNIGGELFYNQRFNYMTRKWTDGEHTFSDPVLQVRRHRRQLQHWLSIKNLPDLPIYCLVSNSPETSIDTDDPDLNIVIRTDALPEKIEQVEASHAGPSIDPTSLDRLTKNLLDDHTENHYDYLDKFSLNSKDFNKEVICPTCQHVPMRRIYGTWQCQNCGYKNAEAHLAALRDYYFLYGSSITNKKMRDFLMLDSPDIANRILSNMNLSSSGKNKGRVYFLNF
ncbi:Nuclease-related domain-containing protein [Halobacillus dabanensis]|uniref:Nuclease-related domain-containing protein n=2 Tax=Halobacillus dabanensis TaxID=240302 RepID=A0A1I3RKT0_HALDA|nr:Nuclease-related domain-containing protein [Halobacillus dabanensis]